MKNLKTFSSALAMLICSLSFAQENNVPEIIQEKTSIEKIEKPMIRLGRNPTLNKPLYVIDGSISNDNILKAIKPENIKNITVLKENIAIGIYGQEAQYGVIIIETKDLTKKQLRRIKKNSEKALKEQKRKSLTTKNF